MRIEWADEVEKEALPQEPYAEPSPVQEARKTGRGLEPVRAALSVVAGKWKHLILQALEGQPLRYGALLRRIPGASRKVLTEHLRDLERDRVVTRMVYGERAAHVEYSLSAHGRTLLPVLTVLGAWGAQHLQDPGSASVTAPEPQSLGEPFPIPKSSAAL